jgi:RimJ/RimL family protein N-acetyltransferase
MTMEVGADMEYDPIPIEELWTERLWLRPLALSDAPKIQTLFPNPNALKYMASAIPWPYPETGAIEFVTRRLLDREKSETYDWVILERNNVDQGLIGFIGMTPASETDNRGFWLGEPYWGRGYMTEAVHAVNNFAFDRLRVKQMRLNNAVANVGSHRLKEKSGAEIVSTQEEEYIGGKMLGETWILTAEKWAEHRDSFLKRG